MKSQTFFHPINFWRAMNADNQLDFNCVSTTACPVHRQIFTFMFPIPKVIDGVGETIPLDALTGVLVETRIFLDDTQNDHYLHHMSQFDEAVKDVITSLSTPITETERRQIMVSVMMNKITERARLKEFIGAPKSEVDATLVESAEDFIRRAQSRRPRK
jgi:hypothetical protein